MTQSLGNTISIQSFLATYSPNQFRYFCVLSHYHSSLNYTSESMARALTAELNVNNFFSLCVSGISPTASDISPTASDISPTASDISPTLNDVVGGFSEPTAQASDSVLLAVLTATTSEIDKCYKNDFNTPAALASLSTFIRTCTTIILSSPSPTPAAIARCARLVLDTLETLGVVIPTPARTAILMIPWHRRGSGVRGTTDQGQSRVPLHIMEALVQFRGTVREVAKTSGGLATATALYQASDSLRVALETGTPSIVLHDRPKGLGMPLWSEAKLKGP